MLGWAIFRKKNNQHKSNVWLRKKDSSVLLSKHAKDKNCSFKFDLNYVKILGNVQTYM